VETIKALFDALKTTTYGVTAVLLPGATVLELLRRITPLNSLVVGAVGYVAAAYVCGSAVQGVASVLFGLPLLRRAGAGVQTQSAEEHARRILELRLGEKIDRDRVLDLCLSAVETRRDVYDKFIALRDMSRGLALAAVIAAAVIAILHHGDLLSVRYGLALAISLLAVTGFVDRYRRFAPLGRQVIYAQFIVAQTRLTPPSPRTASDAP
jgi:hypothetical protein